MTLLLFSSFNAHSQLDVVYTIIDGEKVAEFGDRGKAPNQYKLKVGDLNTISSTIVTQYQGKTYVLEAFGKDQGAVQSRNNISPGNITE